MPRSTPAINDGRREQALGLLAADVAIGEVARVVGVDRGTVRRWARGAPSGPAHAPRGEVAAAAVEVSAARAEVLTTMAEGQRKLAAAIAIAVDVLIDQVNDKALDARDRRAAACEVLDRAGLVTEQRHAVTVAAPMDRAEVLARVEARVAARQITARNSDPAAK